MLCDTIVSLRTRMYRKKRGNCHLSKYLLMRRLCMATKQLPRCQWGSKEELFWWFVMILLILWQRNYCNSPFIEWFREKTVLKHKNRTLNWLLFAMNWNANILNKWICENGENTHVAADFVSVSEYQDNNLKKLELQEPHLQFILITYSKMSSNNWAELYCWRWWTNAEDQRVTDCGGNYL